MVVTAAVDADVDGKGDIDGGQDRLRKSLCCEELGGMWRSERCVDGSRSNIICL